MNTLERYRDAANLCEGLHDFVSSEEDRKTLLMAAEVIRRESLLLVDDPGIRTIHLSAEQTDRLGGFVVIPPEEGDE